MKRKPLFFLSDRICVRSWNVVEYWKKYFHFMNFDTKKLRTKVKYSVYYVIYDKFTENVAFHFPEFFAFCYSFNLFEMKMCHRMWFQRPRFTEIGMHWMVCCAYFFCDDYGLCTVQNDKSDDVRLHFILVMKIFRLVQWMHTFFYHKTTSSHYVSFHFTFRF